MVGRIQPEAWQAMFALFSGIGNEDYRQMAEAMVKVGITREKVDVDRLTADIATLFRGLNAMDPADVLEGRGADGINAMLSDLGSIARDYGIRFPRSFTMLLKQFLYFDRYVEMLAPGADIFHDERIDLMLP